MHLALFSQRIEKSSTCALPSCSSPINGNSNAAHATCAASTPRLSGAIRACSGIGRTDTPDARRDIGRADPAFVTMTATDAACRRPARPTCCQKLAMLPGYPNITHASSAPMSMPSSSALVATTPRTLPRASLSLSRAVLRANNHHGRPETTIECDGALTISAHGTLLNRQSRYVNKSPSSFASGQSRWFASHRR